MQKEKVLGMPSKKPLQIYFVLWGLNKAERIGGSGDTDVVVKWKDEEDKYVVAIIDGKSKSGGRVSHNDISDVALETHKEKNNADYVAIVGPGFSGDTIRTHARKKGFSLVAENQLTEIARASKELGLNLQEIALTFQVPDGLSQLEDIISTKKRELAIISEVVLSIACGNSIKKPYFRKFPK